MHAVVTVDIFLCKPPILYSYCLMFLVDVILERVRRQNYIFRQPFINFKFKQFTMKVAHILNFSSENTNFLSRKKNRLGLRPFFACFRMLNAIGRISIGGVLKGLDRVVLKENWTINVDVKCTMQVHNYSRKTILNHSQRTLPQRVFDRHAVFAVVDHCPVLYSLDLYIYSVCIWSLKLKFFFQSAMN